MSKTLYQDAEALYAVLRRPGTGQISDAAEIHASPDGRYAAFAGALIDNLEGLPPTRICLTDLTSGDTRVVTFGPHVDRLPKFSPGGQCIAFLSDRHQANDFQLYLLDPYTGAARPTQRVEGWVEYFHWSPDGTRVLLGVAGHGADIAGTQGAVASNKMVGPTQSWMPGVETGDETYRWRCVWVYELATGSVHRISGAGGNVWEAAWCGNDAFAAVTSPGPGEGLWYGARLSVVSLVTGSSRELYVPKDQIGWLAASPSGRHLAVVEAVCSDRWLVAGDLRIIETASGKIHPIDAHGLDVTSSEWRSDCKLLFGGIRGFETVVGLYDIRANSSEEVWKSVEISSAGPSISISGWNEAGDCVLVGESFVRAPEIGVIRDGEYRPVKSFDLGYAHHAKVIDKVERVEWQAPDGLQILGWLLRPAGAVPHPLVMNIHGGPVSNWRPMWLGRPRTLPILMLVARGYAVFFPNPRGSSGRGQDFAVRVRGDLGGADTYDLLSGLDHLVERGVADPERLGVMGISYGGYMSSWLITQDSRFAAAVAVAPVTNRISQRLICAHGHFVDLFLGDVYHNPNGKYFQRSPIMHAHKARTPTLNICGALDRCTPPDQAMQFHNALLENGVPSVLVTYPQEGHGVRKFPAAIDYAARVVAWFETHLKAR